jgi:hypothetical protein
LSCELSLMIRSVSAGQGPLGDTRDTGDTLCSSIFAPRGYEPRSGLLGYSAPRTSRWPDRLTFGPSLRKSDTVPLRPEGSLKLGFRVRPSRCLGRMMRRHPSTCARVHPCCHPVSRSTGPLVSRPRLSQRFTDRPHIAPDLRCRRQSGELRHAFGTGLAAGHPDRCELARKPLPRFPKCPCPSRMTRPARSTSPCLMDFNPFV